MIAAAEWFRSERPDRPRDLAAPPAARRLRNWLRECLPEPRVRGKTVVLYARRGMRRGSWAGLFSEFHSVLGALKFAEDGGASAVRVEFSSPLYVDPERGLNWWPYFFEDAVMALARNAGGGEVHLNRTLARYGRRGGFCDVVNGATPHLYPMTYGLTRSEVHRLLSGHVHVRPEIRRKADAFIATAFEAGAYRIGVHYRGTDSVQHYPYYRIPYTAYAGEVRRVLECARPRAFQILVATDERDCLAFMQREFGDRVVFWDESPRVAAGAPAIHADTTLGVSNYRKGETAIVDALLLAATSYLVKGRSNLSDASLAFNPRLPYSFCIR